MVYIHMKKVGDKKYYTLRISLRDKSGKVITKDLENLGSDLSLINLDRLEKKYKKEIRHSYRSLKRFLESNHYLEAVKKKKHKSLPYFADDQLLDIEAAHAHFTASFSKLDRLTKKEVYGLFLIKFAVSSTSIEGNTINLAQATRLLREQIVPKDKTLREVYDLQNTQQVFFDLLERLPPLSMKTIAQIHGQLLERIDNRLGYRTHDIRIFGQPFSPTPGRYVQDDMKLLLKWYRKHEKNMHPLALAIFFHHKFENIHPFSDGNGRTGRMITNLILLRNGYPPFLIPETTRKDYLGLMNAADKAIKKDLFNIEMKHYQPLFDFMSLHFVKTYWNTFLV